MKKLFLIALAASIAFVSCDEDDPIIVKDYGLKKFIADLGYDSEAGHGEVKYKQQTFFAFGEENALAIGNYGADSWTNFNTITSDPDYNVSADVEGWELLFSNYTTGVYNPDTDETEPYGVTGTLINPESGIKVAKIEFTDSEDPATITQAFAELSLVDLTGLSYSSDIEFIGYNWKKLQGDFPNFTYKVQDHWFFILEMPNGDYYKLRFIGFYGTSMDDRVANFEYQLMQ